MYHEVGFRFFLFKYYFFFYTGAISRVSHGDNFLTLTDDDCETKREV